MRGDRTMLKWALQSKWRSAKADEKGKVAIIVALSVLPIASVAGFAVDFQLITTKKNKLQLSLDSAAIAGCRALQLGSSHDDVKGVVQEYFDSVSGIESGLVSCQTPHVEISDTTLVSDSTCTQQTTLGAVAGVEDVDYGLHSVCTYGIGGLDVAFVFDVSGSMQGSRMTALKAAAKDAIDTLLPEDAVSTQNGDVRVAMVAYNDSLDAGDLFESATGHSPNRTYSYYHYYYRRWFSIPYSTTCVYERIGNEAYTDAAPDHSISVENTGSHNSGDYITAADFWDRDECRNAPPLALTTDRETLKDYVDGLDPEGGTAGHLGVAWGWYMISPEWADFLPTAPTEYNEPDYAKALILMTDGDFNAVHHWELGSSSAQARDICDNIKDSGVVIYSVAFQAPSTGEAVLQDCATSDQTFFDPSNGQELSQAYQTIATSISDLRISE